MDTNTYRNDPKPSTSSSPTVTVTTVPSDFPSTDVKQMASHFNQHSGSVLPQTSHDEFLQNYRSTLENQRRSSIDTKIFHSQYRAKGDDVLSEHERSLRLEAEALRLAKLEALANLHKYRGGMAFLISYYRAKLGLPLTDQQKSLLSEEHRLSRITIQWTPEEIAFARQQALEGTDQPQNESTGEQGSTPTTTTSTTTTTTNTLPVSPSHLDEVTRQQEAETIMTLLTGLVQQENHCLSINELSEGLARTSGASWGQYWEHRHGPLLYFLRKYMIPGVHILLDNHWFGFDGMVPPSSTTDNDTYAASSSSALTVPSHRNQDGPRTDSLTTISSTTAPLLLENSVLPDRSVSSNWIDYDMEKFDQALTSKREQELREQEQRLQFRFEQETAAAEEERNKQQQQQLRYQIQQQKDEWEQRKKEDELRLIERIRQELSIEQDNRNRQIAEDAILARRIAEEEHLAMTASSGMNAESSRAAMELRRNRVLTNYPPPLHHRPTASLLSSVSTGYPSAGRRDHPTAVYPPPSHASTYSTDSSALIPHHRTNTSTSTTGMVPYTAGGSGYGSFPQHSHQPSWDAESFARQSIQRLGGSHCDGDDVNITPADFDLLFRPMLVHGFTLIKHGRQGAPKKRRFWMTNSLNRLYWDSAKFFDVVIGTGERCIEMSSVIQIIDGVGTDLLRRKLATGTIYSGHEGRFFSLVTTDRTFDLECSSRNQQMILVRALNWITNRDKRSGLSSAMVASRSTYVPIAPTLPPPPASLLLLGNGPGTVPSYPPGTTTTTGMGVTPSRYPVPSPTMTVPSSYGNNPTYPLPPPPRPSHYSSISTNSSTSMNYARNPNYRSGSNQYGYP